MKVIDAHTHLSGSESEESAEGIVACLDVCEVENAFVFAPLLNVHTWELTDKHLDDIRAHNDYCADLCSRAPERLYGFCVLNPVPRLAGGSFKRAVELMIEEVRRCYHELGLRGVKMIPTHWYPNDPEIIPLYQAIAQLGMKVETISVDDLTIAPHWRAGEPSGLPGAGACQRLPRGPRRVSALRAGWRPRRHPQCARRRVRRGLPQWS